MAPKKSPPVNKGKKTNGTSKSVVSEVPILNNDPVGEYDKTAADLDKTAIVDKTLKKRKVGQVEETPHEIQQGKTFEEDSELDDEGDSQVIEWLKKCGGNVRDESNPQVKPGLEKSDPYNQFFGATVRNGQQNYFRGWCSTSTKQSDTLKSILSRDIGLLLPTGWVQSSKGLLGGSVTTITGHTTVTSTSVPKIENITDCVMASIGVAMIFCKLGLPCGLALSFLANITRNLPLRGTGTGSQVLASKLQMVVAAMDQGELRDLKLDGTERFSLEEISVMDQLLAKFDGFYSGRQFNSHTPAPHPANTTSYKDSWNPRSRGKGKSRNWGNGYWGNGWGNQQWNTQSTANNTFEQSSLLDGLSALLSRLPQSTQR
jgi:hypothetical protein